jgi:hypothetical protein
MIASIREPMRISRHRLSLRESAVLKVPSAIVMKEWNYLLNPALH